MNINNKEFLKFLKNKDNTNTYNFIKNIRFNKNNIIIYLYDSNFLFNDLFNKNSLYKYIINYLRIYLNNKYDLNYLTYKYKTLKIIKVND